MAKLGMLSLSDEEVKLLRLFRKLKDPDRKWVLGQMQEWVLVYKRREVRRGKNHRGRR